MLKLRIKMELIRILSINIYYLLNLIRSNITTKGIVVTIMVLLFLLGIVVLYLLTVNFINLIVI